MLDTFVFSLDMFAKAGFGPSFKVALITHEGLQLFMNRSDVNLQTSLHCS